MATLVLSTVGTVLGGPVGSAIGALIGQSIDQQLLASPRRGPRVAVETTRAKSLLGRSLGVLAGGTADLIDDENSVDIALIDADQWLTSCEDPALAAGSNLAVLGSELIQFGSATALGGGKFRLSHLLRGRGGRNGRVPGML